MSDSVWLAIVGLVALVIKEYFDRLRARDAAQKVEKVKVDLASSSKDTDRKLDSVAEKIEIVHKATNSMKDQLVEAVRDASFAKGVQSELDKK